MPVLILLLGRFAPTPVVMLSMGRAGSRSPVLAIKDICSPKWRLKGGVVGVTQAESNLRQVIQAVYTHKRWHSSLDDRPLREFEEAYQRALVASL